MIDPGKQVRVVQQGLLDTLLEVIKCYHALICQLGKAEGVGGIPLMAAAAVTGHAQSRYIGIGTGGSGGNDNGGTSEGGSSGVIEHLRKQSIGKRRLSTGGLACCTCPPTTTSSSFLFPQPTLQIARACIHLQYVLCCAVLCCAVLCCAVLCCAVLCRAALCCAAPCHAVLSVPRRHCHCCTAVVPPPYRYQNEKRELFCQPRPGMGLLYTGWPAGGANWVSLKVP